jgi:hypothetical protein
MGGRQDGQEPDAGAWSGGCGDQLPVHLLSAAASSPGPVRRDVLPGLVNRADPSERAD